MIQNRLNMLHISIRFEMEIQNQMAGEDLPKVVIGSNTYNTVSAQLKMLRGASGVSVEERERKHREVFRI